MSTDGLPTSGRKASPRAPSYQNNGVCGGTDDVVDGAGTEKSPAVALPMHLLRLRQEPVAAKSPGYLSLPVQPVTPLSSSSSSSTFSSSSRSSSSSSAVSSSASWTVKSAGTANGTLTAHLPPHHVRNQHPANEEARTEPGRAHNVRPPQPPPQVDAAPVARSRPPPAAAHVQVVFKGGSSAARGRRCAETRRAVVAAVADAVDITPDDIIVVGIEQSSLFAAGVLEGKGVRARDGADLGGRDRETRYGGGNSRPRPRRQRLEELEQVQVEIDLARMTSGEARALVSNDEARHLIQRGIMARFPASSAFGAAIAVHIAAARASPRSWRFRAPSLHGGDPTATSPTSRGEPCPARQPPGEGCSHDDWGSAGETPSPWLRRPPRHDTVETREDVGKDSSYHPPVDDVGWNDDHGAADAGLGHLTRLELEVELIDARGRAAAAEREVAYLRALVESMANERDEARTQCRGRKGRERMSGENPECLRVRSGMGRGDSSLAGNGRGSGRIISYLGVAASSDEADSSGANSAMEALSSSSSSDESDCSSFDGNHEQQDTFSESAPLRPPSSSSSININAARPPLQGDLEGVPNVTTEQQRLLGLGDEIWIVRVLKYLALPDMLAFNVSCRAAHRICHRAHVSFNDPNPYGALHGAAAAGEGRGVGVVDGVEKEWLLSGGTADPALRQSEMWRAFARWTTTSAAHHSRRRSASSSSLVGTAAGAILRLEHDGGGRDNPASSRRWSLAGGKPRLRRSKTHPELL